MTDMRVLTVRSGQASSIPASTRTQGSGVRLASNGRVSAKASSAPTQASLTPQARTTK